MTTSVFVEEDIAYIFIVEFKSRNAHSSEIEEKLFNCSKKAIEILESVGNPLSRFYPIVMARTWRPIEHRKIKEIKLPIRGRNHNVMRPKSGDSLSNIVARFE